jgi:hypothetical protein
MKHSKFMKMFKLAQESYFSNTSKMSTDKNTSTKSSTSTTTAYGSILCYKRHKIH